MAPEALPASSDAPATSGADRHRSDGRAARKRSGQVRDAASYDLVVIGGGAAGLAAARAGRRRGHRTVLVSDSAPGGDCTFTGCVPSKTLIESAALGMSFEEATTRMRTVVAQIAATEDAEVLAGEGIEVIEGRARFVGPRTVAIEDQTIRAKRVVVATGSRPAVPSIPGLPEVDYLTNETVFDLTELPASIAILGGGAIGCELAQAFGCFGSQVQIIEGEDRLLPREEPEAGTVLAGVFSAEGIGLRLGVTVRRVGRSASGTGIAVECSDGSSVVAEALLVTVGRTPGTSGLDAPAGGVELDERGYVRTDRFLATSAARVYAAGDVAGRLLFTHAADEMGRLAVGNAFGPLGRLGR
ncbi:MAG: FAD-dependent oxidoreductase, partial [Acidimicrobiales bacterium]